MTWISLRTCTGCGLEQELDKFPPHKGSKMGRARQCRSCWNVRFRRHYRRKNGWTDELVDQVLAAQDNACAVCLTPITEQTAAADHDHATGRPRGLLCHGCNRGLGQFKDNPDRLQRAIGYLNQHQGAHV
jgi:hypothetical protein